MWQFFGTLILAGGVVVLAVSAATAASVTPKRRDPPEEVDPTLPSYTAPSDGGVAWPQPLPKKTEASEVAWPDPLPKKTESPKVGWPHPAKELGGGQGDDPTTIDPVPKPVKPDPQLAGGRERPPPHIDWGDHSPSVHSNSNEGGADEPPPPPPPSAFFGMIAPTPVFDPPSMIPALPAVLPKPVQENVDLPALPAYIPPKPPLRPAVMPKPPPPPYVQPPPPIPLIPAMPPFKPPTVAPRMTMPTSVPSFGLF